MEQGTTASLALSCGIWQHGRLGHCIAPSPCHTLFYFWAFYLEHFSFLVSSRLNFSIRIIMAMCPLSLHPYTVPSQDQIPKEHSEGRCLANKHICCSSLSPFAICLHDLHWTISCQSTRHASGLMLQELHAMTSTGPKTQWALGECFLIGWMMSRFVWSLLLETYT
jgi:hypothetical protein